MIIYEDSSHHSTIMAKTQRIQIDTRMMSTSEQSLLNTSSLTLSAKLIQHGDDNGLTKTKTASESSLDDAVLHQAHNETRISANNNGASTKVKLLRSPRLKIEHLKKHIVEDTTTSSASTSASQINNSQIDQAAGFVTSQQDDSMDTTGLHHVNRCTLANGVCTAVTATTSSQVVQSTALSPTVSAAAVSPMVRSPLQSPPKTQSASFEQLTKIRQENLARRRGQIQPVMMPELSEDAEMDTSAENTASNTSTGQPTCQSTVTVASRVTKTNTSSTSDSNGSIGTSAGGDNVNTTNNNSNKELNRIPSSPLMLNEDVPSFERSVSDPATPSAFPSLPDDVLKKMGLSSTELKIKEKETSPVQSDEDPKDQEIENQFLSLALAFKTDKLTLDKRLVVQERSRDVTEENIAKDMEELRGSITNLNPHCAEDERQELLANIQLNIDILTQSVARLSARTEVLGAVQQEGRMSKAIEVMVYYVEVLKRKYEKEHTDLEEAKRLLQDSNVSLRNGSVDIGSLDNMNISRRSLTNPSAAAVGGPKVTRRRNSVAVLPRMTGMPGLPGLSGSPGLPGLPPSPTSPLAPLDMRNRFKTAFTHTTSSIRRRSLEKSALLITHPSKEQDKLVSIESYSTTAQSDAGSTAASEEKEAKEEEAFQKGFEKGIRAQLSKDLGTLRRDQQNIHEILDRLMDENQDMDEEEDEDSNTQKNNRSFSIRHFISHDLIAGVKRHHSELRLVVIGLLIISAMLTLLFTLFPLGSASLLKSTELRHYGRPPS